MENRFFNKTEFNNRFGKEMASAGDVFERRKKSGIRDYALATYDFTFTSDAKDKLEALGAFLTQNYEFKVGSLKKKDDHWEISGDATEFPVDDNNLMFWVIDLYTKGYEFDCKLDGYGATSDPQNQLFPNMDADQADHYFSLAMDCYNKRNFGMAIIHFSTAIKINPDDPNSWFSRATIKDELQTWKSARRDYDKALEIAPNFTDAILNRAANKDQAGEYQEAINDYSKVIELEPENEMAYFNRGNSKFNMNETKRACEDWNKARELGAPYAQARIDMNCNKPGLLKKAKGLFNW